MDPAIRSVRSIKPAMLCVVPPYSTLAPPAGPAYLLAYLRQHGCEDFGFLDLRLGVPDAYAPTYNPTGVFGEAFVMDVPDLPLVLALVAACDEGRDPTSGFAAVIEDYCLQRGLSSAYLHRYLISTSRYLETIAAQLEGVEFVGCTVWTSNYLTTLLFAAHLKRLKSPPFVVAGGPQTTESKASAAIALRSRLLDTVVVGEGEASLLAVYERFAQGGPTNDPLPGTFTADADGKIQRGAARPLLPGDHIPTPEFDQMHILSYQHDGQRTVPYHLSRGCTDKCTFCSEWVFWQHFRPGSSSRTLEGVKELHKRYGAEHIQFTDSLLNGHPGRLRDFAEGMARARKKVAWSAFMRAQVDAEMADLLRRAKCESVFIGVESMSTETLALMRKRRTELENTNALRAFMGAGINVIAGLIPGFPGDPREAFMHTVARLRELQAEFPGLLRINVEPFIVSPGQPLMATLESSGLRGIVWPESVLASAPRYRDLTESIFCTVEGNNQGLERIGRLTLSEAIQTDEPIGRDAFNYRDIDPLSSTEFTFEHLSSGWFVARVTALNGWIVAVIVDETEREAIEDAVGRCGEKEVLGNAGCVALLRRLQRRHIVPPRLEPTVVVGGYDRPPHKGTRYRLAPYVVARRGDWRVGNRILIVDAVTNDSSALPAWHEVALKALAAGPQTEESLALRLRRRGITKPARAVLDDYLEQGAVLIESGTNGATATAAARTQDRPGQVEAVQAAAL